MSTDGTRYGRALASRVAQSLKRNALTLAVAGLALAGGYGLRDNATDSTKLLAKAQVVACQKANEVRRESNARITSAMALKAVVTELLHDSIESQDGAAGDTPQASEYRKLLARIDREVNYHRTPVVSCKDIVPL